MKSNGQKIKFALICLITFIAAGFFVTTLQESVLGKVDNSYSESVSTSTPVYEKILFNAPSRLQIPSIKVDAKVQEVGVTPKGTMGIPSNFTDVAWYKYGTIPGEIGSAVIDGHVDNGLSLPGVFKNLDKVKIGDKIYVIDKEGTKISFVVSNIDHYEYKDAPTDEIFHEDKEPLLRLITCEGKWVKSDRTYDTRLVVTAKRVGN